MSDQPSGQRPNLAFLPIGITFMMLGVVFMAALDSIALGLVFLPVGVVFIAVSLQEGDGGKTRGDARKDGGDGTVPYTATDTDGPGGDSGAGGDGGGGD